MTILGFLLDAVDADAEHPFAQFIEDSGRTQTITYGEAFRAASGLATQLKALGVGPGDRFICYSEDTLCLMYGYLAAAMLRASIAPLSPLFSEGYLKSELMEPLGAKVVVVQETAGVSDRSLRQHLVRVGPQGVRLLDPMLEQVDDAAVRKAAVDSTPDAAFVIQPTSGSTGLPKLVLRRHSAFLRYAQFVGNALKARDTSRILCAAALTHAFAGHMFSVGLRMRSTFVIPRGIDTSVLLEDMWELDPTVAPMTPRVQAALISRFRRKSRPPAPPPPDRFISPSCKLVVSAGGPAVLEYVDFFSSQDMEFMEFYGSSEASIVALTQPGEWRPGVAGQFVPDVQAEVATDGELLVKSPGLLIEYVGDPAKTQSAFTTEGFYRTGDAASIESGGVLRILGRKRDLFNTAEGCHIFPATIEQAIEAIPNVRQAMIMGDGRQFLVALVSMDLGGIEHSGWMEPAEFLDEYFTLGRELQRINSDRERVEQVATFAITADPFPPTFYQPLAGGKVRRDRPRAHKENALVVNALYGTSLPLALRVPGIERRLRPRRNGGSSTIPPMAAAFSFMALRPLGE